VSDWSSQQNAALKSVEKWLADPTGSQIFRLFGYAGTGKTTLAQHLVSSVKGEVYFAAFTGKAAHVLGQKGCPNPSTIHRLIYQPKDKSRQRLRDLEANRAKLLTQNPVPQQQVQALDKEIAAERSNLGRPMFQLNMESPLKRAGLVVVDEASMVGRQMGQDLASFGCKILALGDPAQLPPVQDASYFSPERPDVMLTQIHRQAAENPIIRLSQRVREDGVLPNGVYGGSRVVSKGELSRDELAQLSLSVDQLLVGRNETRRSCNQRIRQLKGYEKPTPVAQDKIVCLRNDHEQGLLNGQIWFCEEEGVHADETLYLRIANEEGERMSVVAHDAHFLGRELDWTERRNAQEFDYGYALTVHKAQGSQWDNVLILDEWRQAGTRRQWLYTAVTRAAENVTVVKM
jgi:exodeoxyribonuclease V